MIDDEKQMRKLLRIVLEDQDYRVFEAENGRQGLAEAAQRKPDV
ncbi:MAG TPA: response regulator, partial [Candidatus Binatia bacterium]|nr:response regulator [Candidatus Binatia bacterium]